MPPLKISGGILFTYCLPGGGGGIDPGGGGGIDPGLMIAPGICVAPGTDLKF